MLTESYQEGSGDRKESGRETSCKQSGSEMLTRSGCGGRSPLPGRGRWQRQLLLVHPLPEPSRWLWTVVRCVLFLKQCAFKNTIYLL